MKGREGSGAAGRIPKRIDMSVFTWARTTHFGAQAMACTEPLWPLRVWLQTPSTGSQIRIAWSPREVARQRPSAAHVIHIFSLKPWLWSVWLH